MRRRVKRLHEAGLLPIEIAKRLGVVKSTVAYHLRNLDVPIETKYARRYDWEVILGRYREGMEIAELMAEDGFSRFAFYEAASRAEVEIRPAAIPLEELLVVGRRTKREHLKRRLLAAGVKENRCETCGLFEWQGRPLTMQLHHINGNGLDNRLANLQFLCSNCHSQTSTFAGRNKRAGRSRLMGADVERCAPQDRPGT